MGSILAVMGELSEEASSLLFDLPALVEEQPCLVYAAKPLGIVGPIATGWTEAQLQDSVERLCRFYQLRYHHCRDARHCTGTGFPDLIIVGPAGILWRELKVKGRSPAFDQLKWADNLISSGSDWKVWTEIDYESGLITRELAGICELAVMGQIPMAA